MNGSIPTDRLKQTAQKLASHTLGVTQVANCVRVTGSSDHDGSSVVGYQCREFHPPAGDSISRDLSARSSADSMAARLHGLVK